MFPGNLSSVCCGSQRARKMVTVLREVVRRRERVPFFCCSWCTCMWGSVCDSGLCIGRGIQGDREGQPKGQEGQLP